MPLISPTRGLTALILSVLLPPLADAAVASGRVIAAPAITGTVRSKQEGPLEGVIVSAQRKDDGVLTAVSTDATGRFAFPRDHVGAGLYTITVRATGFEWPGSAGKHRVMVTSQSPAALRIMLEPVKDPSRLASQLTSLEWLNSFPGSDAQKDVITHNVVNCGFCHSLERVARSNHTADEFRGVIARMSTYEPDHSGTDRIQIAAALPPVEGLHWWGRDVKSMADYLATVNLSGGKPTWSYPLKVLPRPQGKATRAIVTVFPIPRPQSVIHDLDVDSKGAVWYGNTGWDYLGRFDPATGRFSEWAAPNHLPPAAAGLDRIQGVQDIQVDPDDHVWAAVGGTKIAMFAPERAEWRAFDVPVVWLNPFRAPIHRGQRAIWVTGVTPANDGVRHEAAFRLDIDSGKLGQAIQLYDGRPAPDDPGHANPFHYCYMMDQDTDGNFLCTDPPGSALVRADAATGRVKLIPTITPYAYPRRGYRDEQNRFWFGEFYADKIGVIDLNTDVIKEYDTAQKFLSPYYARPDRHGRIWVSSTGSDRLLRLDPRTGEILQYLMPVAYDARKVVVDFNAQVTTVWLPNKNAAQLIRIEVPD